MKKITMLVFLSFCAIGFSQNKSQDQNKEIKAPTGIYARTVELPAAYFNNPATTQGESAGVANNGQRNTNVTVPFTGTYHNNRPDAMIYDNGPYFNVAGSPDLSVLQSVTLGMGTYGAGAQFTAGNSVADDVVFASDVDITSIDVFAYQSFETAPTVTGVYLQVWDGDPSASGGGASVIWGNLTDNILGDAIYADANRVLEDDQSSGDRQINRVTANTIGLSLTAGTYWIEYTFEGSGTSGPWAPPIAILGQSTTGNAIQYQSSIGGWVALEDVGPQGLPFVIYGEIGGGGTGTACDVTHESNNFEDARPCGANTVIIGANDIIVPADTDMMLNKIIPNIWMDPGTSATSVLVNIYDDSSGLPGTLLNTQNVVPTAQNVIGTSYGLNVIEVEMELAPVSLSGTQGAETTYWIGISITTNTNTTVYWEFSTASAIGNPLAISQNGNPFFIPDPTHDGVYTFLADCEPMGGGTGGDCNQEHPLIGETAGGSGSSQDSDYTTAADIVVVAGEDFTIDTIEVPFLTFAPEDQPISATVVYYDDAGGLPGLEIGTETVTPVILSAAPWINPIAYKFETRLDLTPFTFNGNAGSDTAYWISVTMGTATNQATVFWEYTNDTPVEGQAFAKLDASIGDWTIEDPTQEVIYNFSGNCNPLSVADNTLRGFSYYPNPTSGSLSLQSASNIDSVSLFNLLGQKVLDFKIGATTSDINLSGLTAGTYIMHVSVEGQIGTYKVLKN